MNARTCLCLIMTALCLVGCVTVYVSEPLGETPVTLKPEAWEGAWHALNGVAHITTEDPERGLLHVTWKHDGQTHEFEVHLRTSGDWTLASMRTKGAEEDPFSWGRVKKHEDRIILWGADVEKIRGLVERDVLPGPVDDQDNIRLGDLTADHMKTITTGDEGILVDWENPVVLHR